MSTSRPASPPAVADQTATDGEDGPPETVSDRREDATTSSERAAVAADDHVSPAFPEEPIIVDWEQLMSTMENDSGRFDSQAGDMTSEPSVYDHGFSRRVVDDATESSSAFHGLVAEDVPVYESVAEVTIDNDSSIPNGQSCGQYSTINEFRKNLKRPVEFEDDVINNKIKPAEVDFDSLMSGIDVILEHPIFSSDTDRMELTESDNYDGINKIEKQLAAYADDQECETINLISDSEESDLSEMSESESESSKSSESNVESSIDDVLLHNVPDELLDNTVVDFKNECYKKYPQLLKMFNKEDLTFREFERIFSKKKIMENWRTEYNKKSGTSFEFIFNRERKWQATCNRVFQRFKESITILKHYEKYMEKFVNAQPYAVKKIDGLQVEFQSEKEKNLPSQLKKHISEEDCDSTRQSCLNTIKNKLSSPNISEPPVLDCNTNNSKLFNKCEDTDKKPNELNMDNLTSLQPESFAVPTVLTHPVPLPTLINIESTEKLPPSLTLTVQNCPEASDRKAIVLRWNLDINEGDFIEIMCYQIFSYQEISSVKPTSSLWEKLTEVNALPLPMKCTLSFESLQSGQKHYFAIRAVDKYFRLGPFSSIQFIELN